MNVLVNLVRGKIVVQILGAAGIGISTLFHNSAELIQQYSMLGINVSAVRDISQAKDEASPEVLSATVGLVRRLMRFSALFGLLSTLLFAFWLTDYFFADSTYLPFVMMMSVAIMFNIMGAGEYTILQGMRRYKHIALSSTIPPLCGLLMGVPIYLLMGVDGIVPAMITMSVVYYVAVRYLSRRALRNTPPPPRVGLRTMWTQGKGILQFGIVMTIAGLLGTVTTFSISAFIKLVGSDADLGLYASANTITLQYITLVFSAMAANYYPMLANVVHKSMKEAHVLVNQESEVVLLVITPISMLIVLTAPVLIYVLLKSDMMPIQGIVRFMGLAAFFRGFCFAMDYISLSKGDKKFFFWLEGVWSNVKTFSLLALFYYLYGLDGLGYAVLLSAMVDAAVSFIANRWRYGFRMSKASVRLSLQTFLMAGTCFACSFIPNAVLSYSLMLTLTLAGCIFSYRQLDKRVDLRNMIASKLKRNR